MKVSITHTLEVSDTQRVQIADVLDGQVTKRQATRDEMKDYIWDLGKSWENVLQQHHRELTGANSSQEEDEDEDLIGQVDDDELGDIL